MTLDTALAVAAARRRLPPPAVRRQIREASGASQRDVAHEIGVDPAQVSRWESGQREPRGENAIRYAAILRRLMEAVA